MAVPPFPSQDLARLVLGYLAEEELMTAYDVFLQTSPYLDAFKNEYNRIFMTSLRNIMAEYWAVKIYVETCKPNSLRKRLFGCSNLLDIVKFLVQHVDINKIQGTKGEDSSYGSMDSKTMFEKTSCAVCRSLKLGSCVCKSRLHTITEHTNPTDAHTIQQSVETTSLEDLPGNHATSRRKVRVLPRENQGCQSEDNSDSDINTGESQLHSCRGIQNTEVTYTGNHQFGNAVNFTIGTSSVQSGTYKLDTINISKPTSVVHSGNDCHSISAGTFQDFSKGVGGGISSVPDSSTSESLNAQSSVSKDSLPRCKKSNNEGSSVNTLSKAHIFLTVGTIKGDFSPQVSNADDMIARNHIGSSQFVNIRPKPNDQKVTILSDVKVDKPILNEKSNLPAVLKNATSTPVMHMQTILINGTPVYKQLPAPTRRNFTKDEIMAMPTIIVVPKSGPSLVPSSDTQTLSTNLSNVTSTPICTESTSRSLGPLVIDVAADSPSKDGMSTETNNMPVLNQTIEKVKGKEMLVKTLEVKHVSLPKNGIENIDKCTPSVNPPVRKASSTPRRTSHVRVLDFNTPRRILDEVIDENCEGYKNDQVEVIVSRSPNLHTFVDSASCDAISNVEEVNAVSDDQKSSESSNEKHNNINIAVPIKRNNWDADLRAIANKVNKTEDIPESRIKPRCKPYTKPKVPKNNKLSVSKKGSDMKNRNDSSDVNKNKITKNKRKLEEVVEETYTATEDTVSVQVKPTINIITGSDRNSQQDNEKTDSSHNKSVEEPADTPEMDRLCLQNAIGVKLNISDLLETPYKQALYDIQMETPRFLGPDLPGEPLSDIKITNIPTPRFLNNTPKPTPSSYSSRPTDYSSGGSYYKPDDQDYLPIEDIGYPTSSKEDTSANANSEEANESSTQKKSSKSSRPVRKCAKNVSYYNNPQANKTKDVGDKNEEVSSCSDAVDPSPSVLKSSHEKESVLKQVKSSKTKTKSENKKSKKHKTPVKREAQKTFMKIKPRRITPTKENLSGKSKRKTSEGQGKKRTSLNAKPAMLSVPTKSRRKSSTPRKLQCTKTFNSESSGHDSPEFTVKIKPAVRQDSAVPGTHDSDTEQLPLRWSDDGSQDVRTQDVQTTSVMNESDDISKIKDFIATELRNVKANDRESNLHVDLVKRGFDIETARIIERDLLDTPPYPKDNVSSSNTLNAVETKKDEVTLDKTAESETSLKIVAQEEDEEYDEIELSVSECNESSENYFTCQHDETNNTPVMPLAKLKDNFSMEVCVDDGVAIRLRTTPFSVLFDQDPKEVDAEPDCSYKEIEMAVSSISSMDKLYTPMKDSIRAQVYDIFDSTLTSLDTPLKVNSPRRKECDTTVNEIVLEVEKVDDKERSEGNKRKRLSSAESDESTSKSKRSKPEAQYLLNSANIQNIDIETVLSKLHGP